MCLSYMHDLKRSAQVLIMIFDTPICDLCGEVEDVTHYFFHGRNI